MSGFSPSPIVSSHESADSESDTPDSNSSKSPKRLTFTPKHARQKTSDEQQTSSVKRKRSRENGTSKLAQSLDEMNRISEMECMILQKKFGVGQADHEPLLNNMKPAQQLTPSEQVRQW